MKTQKWIAGICTLAAAGLGFARWYAAPRPVVSAHAELSPRVEIWRQGVCSVVELDGDQTAAVLACLRRYRAAPQPHRAGVWASRAMGEIPLELELTCADGGPRHIVLGEDPFWYRSANGVPHRIQNGDALLAEVLDLIGAD